MNLSVALKENLGTVGVLFGGQSAEREISLQSGAAIVAALQALSIDHVALDLGADSIADLQSASIDRAFIALHGAGGEDGRIQAVLEFLHIPYTGSGVQASAIAMDKLLTKQLWRGIGIQTPDFEVLEKNTDWAKVLQSLGGAVMVKPVHEGSSIGMAGANTASALQSAYAVAAQYDSRVIAEQLMLGNEYTVTILAGRALPAIKLETDNEFYDYDAKYVSNDTRYICPCGLSPAREKDLCEQALAAFDSLGCTGWGRVDIMEDAAGVFNMLEVNTVPGMTGHSLVPMAAKAAGLGFDALVLDILQESL